MAGKLIPKLALVYPFARPRTAPHGGFTTLLMSTGLTFGTISALYGLNAHIVNSTQFSLIISVVVISAIVPTAVAQRWFSPPFDAASAGRHTTLPPEASEALTGEPAPPQ